LTRAGQPDRVQRRLAAARYARGMAERSRNVKKPLGILGAVAAIASVWWFAFRPQRRKKDQATG